MTLKKLNPGNGNLQKMITRMALKQIMIMKLIMHSEMMMAGMTVISIRHLTKIQFINQAIHVL